MNSPGRPSLPHIDRVRHKLWAANLIAMARAAESEGRSPPAPLQAKVFRSNPLWLERAMRADSTGRLLPSADRPQSFISVLQCGSDPTQCYQRIKPKRLQKPDHTPDPFNTAPRRGPEKGLPYGRATFNLVDLGEALLPGSRKVLDADIWNLLQDAPRSLYGTHLAVEKLLLQFGLVRIHPAQAKPINGGRLRKLQEPTAAGYAGQLNQLLGIYPSFNIDLLSLLANLVHEAYLMGNQELHEMHLVALISHYRKLASLNLDLSVSRDLSLEIERKIINQDWWHAGYRCGFPPIDTSQLLLAKSDWEALKKELPGITQTTGWLRVRLDP